MAVLSVLCPRCHRPTNLEAGVPCSNVLNDGRLCGYSLPIAYSDGNGKYREKFEKHTSLPPASGLTREHSWAACSGGYALHQEFAFASGSVHHDYRNNYLFLWDTPAQGNPVGKVYYPLSGTTTDATGVTLPLNSKPQNLHHHYGNYESHFDHIADGPGLSITFPSGSGDVFQVYQSGNLICTFDPVAQSGQRIV